MDFLAFFNLSTGEIIVICVVALILFGGSLPMIAKNLGKSVVEFKKGCTPGLAFYAMPDELKKILGRNVDLLTYKGVKSSRNPIRRKAILDSAQVYYVAR